MQDPLINGVNTDTVLSLLVNAGTEFSSCHDAVLSVCIVFEVC